MKKTFKGFIIGLITASFLFGSVFAAGNAVSISAILNSVNISVNGVSAAKAGENFTLANGSQVPNSISYKGTTYLPLRKVAELVGKDVSYVGATSTATIADKPEAKYICPAALTYTISYDSAGTPSVDTMIYNVGTKEIKDLTIYINCMDKNGLPVIDKSTGYNYGLFGLAAGYTIKAGGNLDPSFILDGFKGTEIISIEVAEVLFTDGTEWTNY